MSFKILLRGVNRLQFFASLLLISSVLNMWTGTEGWSYHHSDFTMTWETARDWCREGFTDMVAIQNKEEISYLNSYLPKVSGYYWIGIRKINDTWTWVGTNKKLTDEAKNWAKNEPNGKKYNEDCVEIYIKRDEEAGKWNDEQCSKRKTALCYTASCKDGSCVSSHGECVETINNHTCSCFEGFYGEMCENVIKCKPEDITKPDHGTFHCSDPNGNFSYDSLCEYSCDEGYKLKGASMAKCTATTEWSSKPPTCELIQCSELTAPNNGTMHCHHDPKGNFSSQSTCEFACEEGYTLQTSSSSTLLCGATGHWNDSQPSCEIIKCKLEDITTPDHGIVHCSNPNGKFSYDSQCEYSCDEGYELNGASMARCTATTEWSSKPPTCELVQCLELTTPNNGTMNCHHNPKGNFGYQSTCEFACEEGYTLQTSSSSTLLCGATGHWNDSQPSCEIIKCKPEDITTPDHGSVYCSNPNGNFSYDSQCEYSCDEGYKLKGGSMARCTATTEWSSKPPTCELVKCNPDVLTLHHGSVRCSNPNGDFSYDSVCDYSCEEGYVLKGFSTTKCTATTEWTSKPPTCELVLCSELITPNNGTMHCRHNPKGNFGYKSTCEFACEKGYTLQISSSSTLLCEATGHWNDSQPSCKVVKCNPEDVITLHHGSVRCFNPNGDFSYDSVCEYSCEEGYELKGSSMRKCTATTKWTSKPPTCELIKCKSEDITTPDHGSVYCSNPNGNFSYDSQCEYSCDEGYKLKGASMARCTATTEWSSKPPTCEVVQCSELITPHNGTMQCHHNTKGTFSSQSTCEFYCEVGYTLQTSSSSMLLCGATGHWNDSQPSCEIVKCKPEDVTTLHHGSVRCSNPNGDFSYDSVCEYSCEEGYELKGSSLTKCTATTEWTSKPPTCELVQCSKLTTPNNGTMHCHHDPKGNFSSQSSCEFACEEGYTLQTSSSSTLLCGATGHWNDSQPSCEIVKCNPEDVITLHHGSVQCFNPNGDFLYDSVCEYSCEEGYELKGSSTTKCTATTEWTSKPPTCELVQCSKLTTPNNGAMHCHHDPKGNFSSQSTCEFACEEGYTLQTSSSSTLLCGATGHWNDSQPSCEIIKCKPEDITTPDHGSVYCSNPNGNFSYDSQCEYSCDEGYKLNGASMARCTATTEWSSKPPTCELVQCSELITPNNGTMQCHHDTKGNFSSQSTCEFACEEGYTLQTSSSSTLLCGATGHWNDSQPSCEIVKCKPEDVTTLHHGSVRCSNPNGDFSYDSVCEYSCEEGYELKGSSTRKCTATTEWTSKPPTCELVQCSELITPNNGAMQCHHDSKDNFGYQSTCEFACEEGYTLQTSSSSTLLCGATGHWNDSQPSCEIVKCNPADVTTLYYGSVQCSNPNGDFSYDSVCEYSCEEGYELKGASTTKCTATTEWTSKPPTCKFVQCSELTTPNNGAMHCHHDSKDNFGYQSTCEFYCEEGYTLQTSSSSTLLCGATGHWNDSQPSCEIVKCNPADVTTLHHGSVRCSNPNGDFSYDSVCEYSCEEGYELKGASTTKCTATTEWTNKPPTCEPVRCPSRENPANGVMVCTDSSFIYGSKCSYSCEEGYRLQGASEIRCTKTAEWSHEPPRCEAVDCPPLYEPVNGDMNCTLEEPIFGTVCIFICHDGYQLYNNEFVMCNHNGNWSGEVAVCLAQPGPSASSFKVTEVTVGVSAVVGSSCLLSVLWILKKLRRNTNKIDMSNSDTEDPPQVYKNSRDSLI
nr:E-selectin isoform X2 [Misgurnus anguillicaudatus]